MLDHAEDQLAHPQRDLERAGDDEEDIDRLAPPIGGALGIASDQLARRTATMNHSWVAARTRPIVGGQCVSGSAPGTACTPTMRTPISSDDDHDRRADAERSRSARLWLDQPAPYLVEVSISIELIACAGHVDRRRRSASPWSMPRPSCCFRLLLLGELVEEGDQPALGARSDIWSSAGSCNAHSVVAVARSAELDQGGVDIGFAADRGRVAERFGDRLEHRLQIDRPPRPSPSDHALEGDHARAPGAEMLGGEIRRRSPRGYSR